MAPTADQTDSVIFEEEDVPQRTNN